MTPKTLTRLLAVTGLGSLAAIHWLPKKCLPFGSPTATAIMLVGLMLVVHRNPLRMLYGDAKEALEKSLEETPQSAVKMSLARPAPRK